MSIVNEKSLKDIKKAIEGKSVEYRNPDVISDSKAFIQGKGISTTGTFDTALNIAYTGLMPVTAGKTYTRNLVYTDLTFDENYVTVWFFDAAGVKLVTTPNLGTGNGRLKTFVAPAGAVFAATNLRYDGRYNFTDSFTLVEGAVEQTIPSYFNMRKEVGDQLKLLKTSVEATTAAINKESSITVGKNLFNKATVNANKSINLTTGVLELATTWAVSDIIPVFGGSSVVITHDDASPTNGTAFYNNGAFMGIVPNVTMQNSLGVIQVPLNANQMRIMFYDTDNAKDKVQVEYGKERTIYENYKVARFTPDFIRPQNMIVDDGNIKTSTSFPFKNKTFKRLFESEKLDIFEDQRPYIAKKPNAALRNVFIWASPDRLKISISGIDGEATEVLFNSTNFPNLIAGSEIEHVIIVPWERNIFGGSIGYSGSSSRINVITTKGQVYHNYPIRNASYDGYPLPGDHLLFDESVVWDREDAKTPVKTNVGADADLIATGKYKYHPMLPDEAYEMHPAINSDNGYGHGGFPATISKTKQNGATVSFGRFYFPDRSRGMQSNPLGFMGGFEPHAKMSMLATYKSNAQATRMCVFLTNDGGRQWFCRYEFGTNGETLEVDDVKLADAINNAIPRQLDSTGWTSVGAGVYNLRKRSQYLPSAKNKEPEKTKKFKFGTAVNVTSIVSESTYTKVTAPAHGLKNGDVICFEKQDGVVNEWDWIVNTGHTAMSAGIGMYFKVSDVTANDFRLRENVQNPHNNLLCRHIHSVNRAKDGYVIGTGEAYPSGGWVLFLSVTASDSFVRHFPWDDMNFVRLNSLPTSMQRPLGMVLSQEADNMVYIGVDNESTDLGNVPMPAGRTDTFKRSSNGVFKGKLIDFDDASKYECILESPEVCYFFKEIHGVMIWGGQQGHIAVSTDRGKSWTHYQYSGIILNYGGYTSEGLITIDNLLFRIK